MRLLCVVLSGLLIGPVWAERTAPSATMAQVLNTTTSWDGSPLVYPPGKPEVTGVVLEIPPGGETGWHQHPVPLFVYVLDGEVEVVLRDGRSKHARAGESFAEVVNTWHNGRNPGTRPVRLFVVYAGSVGSPLIVNDAR
ncbi:cupin domain-containing protein [Jeongeupia wiesaeckerbachi]|uniref:cupin domain-containing protein n=1 Tax=Jeongeupia wiesaeckerbachi TaxID=3051218 RepID=UPI003D8064A8